MTLPGWERKVLLLAIIPVPPNHPVVDLTFHCAFDRFHQNNSKNTSDRLRRHDRVLESIYSQVIEEFFSVIDKRRLN